MNRSAILIIVALLALTLRVRAGEGGGELSILGRPVSKVEALNIAIAHNGTIRQAQKDVEAAAGVAIQTRAIIFPHLGETASYTYTQDSLIEANQERTIPFSTITLPPPIGDVTVAPIELPKSNNQAWISDTRVVQSIYEGGRLLSATRSARLIREQAFLVFQSTVADTLLSVSNAYDDVLRGAMQVEVRNASVTFLTAYRNETNTKYQAGSLPEFDLIRQEVEVSNAIAQQVQAIGDYRVAKQNFVELLGYNLPPSVSDDLNLNLTTPLEARPYPTSLSTALSIALDHRTEIAALEKEERIRDENIIVAKAGWKPSVQAFAGYQVTSQVQSRNAGDELHGALVGAQLSWALFDGFLTKGRVDEAVALRGKAGEAKAETTRVVELQVRTAWSDLRTARSVLNAQTDNVRKANRALELAQIRYNEGAGTQIDVLNAQTALTEAHGSFVDALRDYSVARASLVRATGAELQWSYGK
jgi:outer membrane protein TolC